MNILKNVLGATLSVLLLSGCGGGGGSSDSSGSSNNNQFRDGERLYLVNYYSQPSNDFFDLSYIEYQKGKFNFSDSLKNLGSVIVTQNRLYNMNEQAEFSLDVNSPIDWTMNIIGDVKTDWQVERINLSGKNIFDTVLPGYRALKASEQNINARFFLVRDGLKNFPNGSYCYRIKSEQNRIPYLNFVPENSISETFNSFYFGNKIYLAYLNQNKYGMEFQLVSDRWSGVNFTSIFDSAMGVSLADSTAVEFNNALYPAVYHQTLLRKQEDEYKILEESIKVEDDPKKIQNYQLKMASIENGCNYYNSTAAESLVILPRS